MPAQETLAEAVVRQLVAAYRKGYFPMADIESGEIYWCNPDTRGVIPLSPPDAFRIPRTLRQRVRQNRFHITADTAFTRVIVECADPDRPGAWIDETIVRTYRLLHGAGRAHSIEAWLPNPHDGQPMLVGGLYGVAIGAAFFGESMFSRPDLGGSDASKVCLVHLVAHLRKQGFTLLDTQMWSEHLARFGCIDTPKREFLRQLAPAVADNAVTWGHFTPSRDDADPPRRRLPGASTAE